MHRLTGRVIKNRVEGLMKWHDKNATPARCCVEGCEEGVRHRKLFCDHHYIQDLESKIEWARDKIFDLEKQTITELEEKLKITIKALDSIVDRYFDLPPEMRVQKGIKESKESLTAKAALKMIGAR